MNKSKECEFNAEIKRLDAKIHYLELTGIEKDIEISKMKQILLEIGASNHKNEKLYNWYCENKK